MLPPPVNEVVFPAPPSVLERFLEITGTQVWKFRGIQQICRDRHFTVFCFLQLYCFSAVICQPGTNTYSTL